MFEFLRRRMSNYAFWTSLFALIPILGQMFGAFEVPEEYAPLCNSVLAFLVAVGIVNNPTTVNKGMLDDSKKPVISEKNKE